MNADKAGADPGILERGAYSPPHVNAEGVGENTRKGLFCTKVRKKWKSECQICTFLESGTKIQGFIVTLKIFFNEKYLGCCWGIRP